MLTSALASGKVSFTLTAPSPLETWRFPRSTDDRTYGDAAFLFCSSLLSCFFLLEFALSRLPANEVGMIVDKGGDFPQTIDAALKKYGESMWFLREQPGDTTTRALNSYIGDRRKWVLGSSQCHIYSPLRLTRVSLFFFPVLKLSIPYA